MSELTIEAAQRILADVFAPWVQALDIRIEAIGNGEATLRMPFGPSIAREGGTVCGQALMALADTAIAFAISGAYGGFRPMTTVTQTTSFLRPAAGIDVVARAKLGKLGRTLAFGDVILGPPGAGEVFATISSTYAILAPSR
jgi:uncharacterized protein (TIGR00369 family)